MDQLLEAKLDWKWRFVARSPVDFEGYDRRFIGSGLYLEDLQADTLKVRVCIDTSGSIGQETLAQFLAELREIIAAYPRVDLHIYYADIELYGPYSIEKKGFSLKGEAVLIFDPFSTQWMSIKIGCS